MAPRPSPAASAARLPDPGPPPATCAGGLARTQKPVHVAGALTVTVTEAPFLPAHLTPDAADAHLTWLREAYGAGDAVKGELEHLADALSSGRHVILTGSAALTGNIDAALRYTLQARHRLAAKTLWTHTAEELLALRGEYAATLVLGGRTAATYFLSVTDARVVIHTTKGVREYTPAALLATLHGTHFTNVHHHPLPEGQGKPTERVIVQVPSTAQAQPSSPAQSSAPAPVEPVPVEPSAPSLEGAADPEAPAPQPAASAPEAPAVEKAAWE